MYGWRFEVDCLCRDAIALDCIVFIVSRRANLHLNGIRRWRVMVVSASNDVAVEVLKSSGGNSRESACLGALGPKFELSRNGRRRLSHVQSFLFAYAAPVERSNVKSMEVGFKI